MPKWAARPGMASPPGLGRRVDRAVPCLPTAQNRAVPGRPEGTTVRRGFYEKSLLCVPSLWAVPYIWLDKSILCPSSLVRGLTCLKLSLLLLPNFRVMPGRPTVTRQRPRHGPTVGPCCAWAVAKRHAMGRRPYGH